MKKYIYILAALSMAPVFALAQSLESDVDAELDAMYSKQAPTQAVGNRTTVLPAAAQGEAQQVKPQPIYIINSPAQAAQASAATQQVQKQPTTVIEASPLAESRAESIRKSRQDAEVQTEQKIVEKLEQSRMEDEKRRADVLFGDKFNSLNQQQQVPVQQPIVAPAPVVVAPVAPAPVIVEKQVQDDSATRELIRQEMAASLEKNKPVEPPARNKYVAGLLGMGDYPDVSNVKGNYALGVAFGNKVDGFIIEGSFLYSNYTVQNRYYNNYNYGYAYNNNYNNGNVDVNQYTGALAAKIQFFDGIVKPVIGGIAAYSYRKYDLKNSYFYNSNSDDANSHAVDLGALVGADLEFSPKYSIGLDFRYMWNLSSRINYGSNNNNYNYNNSYYNELSNTNPIEKLQYYVMTVSGRMNF
ncbi:hypothetical protein B9G69_015700 [Bdellovibrio sp. SKB1291214]|uniref:hypothetical protein n=1 Tax=Bdellovibrio sp. SKB1291214 TaxID=1732569 RepID=UPI00223F0236|nr:hypothetical protein [Bdellovibrio sp. SKB1291214]UYL08488.1 hypothetical protein B9G69_015700 [Bdellovibrio sp. SKB1291214]